MWYLSKNTFLKFIVFAFLFRPSVNLLNDYFYSDKEKYFILTGANEWNNEKAFFNNIYWTKNNTKDNEKIKESYNENAFSEITEIDEEDKKMYNFILDHTLKIKSPCKSGTGWILDFEMPKNNKYPTKFYIATNLHVIDWYNFNNNDYQVELPLNSKLKNQILKSIGKNLTLSNCVLSLLDSNNFYISLYKTPQHEYIQKENQSNVFQIINNNFWFLSHPKATKPKQVYEFKTSNPKLVYTAIDFLGDRFDKYGYKSNERYYKDFAVLEIDFQTESIAQKMTNDFYNKYHKSTTQPQKLNIFAPELMQKYTKQEDLKKNNYYIAGYPGTSNKNDIFNFSTNLKKNLKTNQNTKSHLINDLDTISFKNKHNQSIIGHVDWQTINNNNHNNENIIWNGFNLKNWGYSYVLDNIFLSPGSSGSMAIDKNKNLLGIYYMWNVKYNYGYIEPIRSSGIVENNKIIIPKYDLIKGGMHQKISYKNQIEKFNKNTYLRSINWGEKII